MTAVLSYLLAWGLKAYALRDVELLDINADPLFDALRENPRFQQLTRRLGFSAAADAHVQPHGAEN
ncbi:MAG: hypothetical protein WCC59_10385 [Terriglobales bacterium]